ncbi:hypothetical protein [Alkalihalobacterium bogoriense]|uniref:hypothetical protein n=1 Tax=Alkalihalobacterium bogoriense TaxID=246272 RepID=UPI00047D2D55|nr:hypothetical protein [Alkalihalobacterium bogoriense]
MSINLDVLTALSDLNIPVTFQTYSGKADTYITFFTYLDKPELHGDDKEFTTGQYIQIDVWSKGDYNQLVIDVHNRLKEVGFRKLNFYDLYEKDIKVYHKVMRYVIEKEAQRWRK